MVILFASEKVENNNEEIQSPFHSCKNINIISSNKKTKDNENNFRCINKDQFAEAVALTALNPLNEGVQYLAFAEKVATEVIKNLDKNNRYISCSVRCFSKETTCPGTADEKTVNCTTRKNEIKNGMQEVSKKIRMELALSNNNSDIIIVNQSNVLNLKEDQLINNKLRDFEIGTPNPLGNNFLSDEEFKRALAKSNSERQELKLKFKENNFKYNSERTWLSRNLINNFDVHRSRYREIIYEEAPLFSVIEAPIKPGAQPEWSDSQIANAFLKLSKNATEAKEKVEWSLKNSKLEFSRANGEALGKSTMSLFNIVGQNDLLYYIGMTNQVEEVLKYDPSSCAIATIMDARLRNKNFQNASITLAALIAGPIVANGPIRLFKIGRALFGTEAASLAGISLGSYFIGDSFKQYHELTAESATRSGLGGKNEGTSNVTALKIEKSRNNIKLLLAFVPLDFPEIKTLVNKILELSKTGNKSKIPFESAKEELEKALHQWELTDSKLLLMSGAPTQIRHEIEILINPIKESYKYNESVLNSDTDNKKDGEDN